MKVEKYAFLESHKALLFRLDTGKNLYYGRDVLAGTDIQSLRFFSRDNHGGPKAYKEAQEAVHSYCRSKGFACALGLYKSFPGPNHE